VLDAVDGDAFGPVAGDRVLAFDPVGAHFHDVIIGGGVGARAGSSARAESATPVVKYRVAFGPSNRGAFPRATSSQVEQARQRLLRHPRPVLEKARQMEEEGQHIIKLNIGNIAAFGLEPPDEIVQDMIRNLPNAAGYTDSKGLFAPRKAIVHYTQQKHVKGVTVDDVFLGNGASELITMSMNALLNDGDEVLIPAPDYPLWTASVGALGRNAGPLPLRRGQRLAARPRRHGREDHAANARRRRHQSEQPDRRALSRRAAREIVELARKHG
jgi:DNA-binding transcriptional MocR family regulator